MALQVQATFVHAPFTKSCNQWASEFLLAIMPIAVEILSHILRYLFVVPTITPEVDGPRMIWLCHWQDPGLEVDIRTLRQAKLGPTMFTSERESALLFAFSQEVRPLARPSQNTCNDFFPSHVESCSIYSSSDFLFQSWRSRSWIIDQVLLLAPSDQEIRSQLSTRKLVNKLVCDIRNYIFV